MEKQIFEKTDGIRAKAGEEPLTPKTVRQLGIAISQFFNNGKIIIGRDTRESGNWITKELESGLATAGANIVNIGIVPTPVLAVITKFDPSASGGIMVTASHNPATDNGLKIFHENGDKLTNQEELKIEEIFFKTNNSTQSPKTPAPTTPTPTPDTISLYASKLAEFIDHTAPGASTSGIPGQGFHILTDSAAGASYGLIDVLAAHFGSTVQEIGPKPTGQNINSDCGAIHPEHLAAAISKHPADLGVALDGDGDRIILVDDTGRIWDGDRIVAMLALQLRDQAKLDIDSVVLTQYSNLAAIRYLEQKDIKVEKVDNSDREVLEKCREIDSPLGGEIAGHVIFTPWLSSSDDFMITFLVLSILKQTGKKLSSLWPDYENLPSQQWSIFVREKIPLDQIPGFAAALAAQTDALEDSGRIFVRYSGTEKKLRILVEATDAAKMQQAGDSLSNLIKKEIGHDQN